MRSGEIYRINRLVLRRGIRVTAFAIAAVLMAVSARG